MLKQHQLSVLVYSIQRLVPKKKNQLQKIQYRLQPFVYSDEHFTGATTYCYEI